METVLRVTSQPGLRHDSRDCRGFRKDTYLLELLLLPVAFLRVGKCTLSPGWHRVPCHLQATSPNHRHSRLT